MAVSAMTIKIKGIDVLNKRLDGFSREIVPAVKNGVNESLLVIQGAAKLLCSSVTGRLRNSIHVHPAKRTSRATIEGSVYTAVEYAVYVEFGTGRRGGYPYDIGLSLTYNQDWAGQVAQPFLYPALLRNKHKIADIIAESVRNGVKK